MCIASGNPIVLIIHPMLLKLTFRRAGTVFEFAQRNPRQEVFHEMLLKYSIDS